MPTLKSVQKEIRSFLGVNLRKERLDLEDYEVAKSINADLHSVIGTITCRQGRTKQFSSALSNTVIRRLGKVNGIRYQVAGTNLYRNQSSISSTLSSNLITTIGSYRPLSDATLWAFIADDSAMKKDNGTNLRNWGIAAPTVAPTLAPDATGGSITGGNYQAQYTYVRKSGSTVACESNPSPSSTVVIGVINQSLAATPTASTDPQVDKIRFYRTTAGGTQFLFWFEMVNSTSTHVDGTADSALGSQVATDHDPPVPAHWFTVWQDSGWLCGDVNNPDWLYFSNRFLPEYFPPSQYLELGNADDPLQCAVPHAGMLGVFSRRTKYRVVGNILSGFVGVEAISRRGTPAPNAVTSTEYGLIFPARDGLWETNLASEDEIMSEDINPLFFGETVNDMNPINWSAASSMAAAYYKGRYYFSYPSGGNAYSDTIAVYSRLTKKWYFYQYPMQSLFYEEDVDQLTGGSTDGFVYILENRSTDDGSDISMTIESKDYFGVSPEDRDIYQFFRVDADTLGDTINVEFFIDGVSKGVYPINGTRTRLLNVLPEGSMGFSHRVKITYAGHQRVKVYGIHVIAIPIGGA